MNPRTDAVADDVELLRKLQRQEQVCLDAADLVLTVSRVNAEHLLRRGVSEDRICVIPNGVEQSEALVERLGKLPDYNFGQFIASMSSAENAR